MRRQRLLHWFRVINCTDIISSKVISQTADVSKWTFTLKKQIREGDRREEKRRREDRDRKGRTLGEMRRTEIRWTRGDRRR